MNTKSKICIWYRILKVTAALDDICLQPLQQCVEIIRLRPPRARWMMASSVAAAAMRRDH